MTQLGSIKRDLLEELKLSIETLQRFRPQIEEALHHAADSHDFDHVCARVLGGNLDLYKFPNAVILMEVIEHPNFRTYHGYIAAGDLTEILNAHDMMDREAQLRDCKYLSIAGRRGWERAFKPYGWDHALSVMRRPVDERRQD